MKILLVGTGGVGEAIAVIARDRPWLERVVLADLDLERALEVAQKIGGGRRFPVGRLDASSKGQVLPLVQKHEVDLILNAVEPRFNMPLFDAAFEAGVHYLDMAMSLSKRHPTDPYHETGMKLGDEQFAKAEAWEEKGLLALVGMGVEPGLADVLAAYAAKHLFDEIEEVGARDGANLEVEGYRFAPNFSIWTTIEECLNPPVVFERDRDGSPPNPSPSPRYSSSPAASGRSSA